MKSASTVVAIGGPLRPEMPEAGYRDSFVIALAINASDVAFLIAPSIGMILLEPVGASANDPVRPVTLGAPRAGA